MTDSWSNREHICKAFSRVCEHLGQGLPSLLQSKLTKLSDDQGDQLAAYLELIESWTSRIDLVSPAPTEVLIERHLIDCLAAGLVIDASLEDISEGAWLDVGSGAGLPGVVLAIMFPRRKIYLCEPREKRAVFLKEVKRQLSLPNIDVLRVRAQDIPKEETGELSLMITRALGLENVFLQAGCSLLKPGGYAINMAGPSWSEDSEDKSEIDAVLEKLIPYSLGAQGPARQLAVFRCNGS